MKGLSNLTQKPFIQGVCLYWSCSLSQLGLGDVPRCVLFLLPLLKHGTMICFQTSFSSALVTGQKTLWKGDCWVLPSGQDSNVCVEGQGGVQPVSIQFPPSVSLCLSLFPSFIYRFLCLSFSLRLKALFIVLTKRFSQIQLLTFTNFTCFL